MITLNIPLLSRKSKKKTSLNYHHLFHNPASLLTHSGSIQPYLEQMSMVPKMFELLKFDCVQGKIGKDMETSS